MKENELTKKLLNAGYTKENPPDWVKPWNDFYGGWTYPVKMIYKMTLETPCGLLSKAEGAVTGHMSYGGVEWTLENDCYTVCCPKFDGNPCELNHELLRKPCGSTEKITQCACKITDKPYDYEKSLEKAHDDVWRESKELFNAFNTLKKGRACKIHSGYNRTTKKWKMIYNPQRKCDWCNNTYCTVLQTEKSQKTGNVYYDVKTSWIEKGNGLIPDEQKTVIKKGVKLLEHQISMTICEAIVKYAGWRIKEEKSHIMFREKIEKPSIKREVFNIRCESRLSRDLLQDLADIEEGIQIIHASDEIKMKKAIKRKRKDLRIKVKISSLEKKIRAIGYNKMNDYDQIKAKKLIGLKKIKEIETASVLSKISDFEQITLFG